MHPMRTLLLQRRGSLRLTPTARLLQRQNCFESNIYAPSSLSREGMQNDLYRKGTTLDTSQKRFQCFKGDCLVLTHVILELLRGKTRIGSLFPAWKNADRPAALHMRALPSPKKTPLYADIPTASAELAKRNQFT